MFDDDILELDEELRQNRIERGLEKDTIVARTARTLERKMSIKSLYAEGMSPNDISIVTQIPISAVHNAIAEIERDEAETKQFLMGDMSSLETGGYYAIFQ